MNTSPFPSRLYKRFHPAFTEILSSYPCLHRRIVRLHLYLYYPNLSRSPGKMGHIEQLWIRSHYALNEAIARGDLVQHHKDEHWLHLPDSDPSLVDAVFDWNHSIYNIWSREKSREIGSHSHEVIRHILDSKDFRQPVSRTTFRLGSGRIIEPDAFTLAPLRAAYEVKNGLSDFWSDPRKIKGLSEDYQQIVNPFQNCKEYSLTPVFIAVKLDPTFYDYTRDNNGLCFELGFQIFPPYLEHLRDSIASSLGFRNIVVVPEDPPYPFELDPFLCWLDTVKRQ